MGRSEAEDADRSPDEEVVARAKGAERMADPAACSIRGLEGSAGLVGIDMHIFSK